jgi:hypothetical protein
MLRNAVDNATFLWRATRRVLRTFGRHATMRARQRFVSDGRAARKARRRTNGLRKAQAQRIRSRRHEVRRLPGLHGEGSRRSESRADRSRPARAERLHRIPQQNARGQHNPAMPPPFRAPRIVPGPGRGATVWRVVCDRAKPGGRERRSIERPERTMRAGSVPATPLRRGQAPATQRTAAPKARI